MTGDALSEERYQTLHQYISQAHEGGISHLVLHARAAVLSGLSPTKNRLVPALDYGVVEKVAKDFPLQVTLNGGISCMPQLIELTEKSATSGVSSFMAGRWMLQSPLDIARIQNHLSELESPADHRDSIGNPSRKAVQAVEQYTDYLKHCIQQLEPTSTPTVNDLCLPLFMITEQIREAYAEDEFSSMESPDLWLDCEDIESIYDNICDTVVWLQELRGARKKKFSPSSIEFNKLSSSFKGLVGTKVASKWKRNRAEL
jgi:tRNA-dihydrouridine synthase